MAVHGTLVTPYEFAEYDFVDIPSPDLITPFDTPDPGLLGPVLANRFPTPPAAMGFLWNLDAEIVIDQANSPIPAALAPFSDYYLEPTTGQIWPRG